MGVVRNGYSFNRNVGAEMLNHDESTDAHTCRNKVSIRPRQYSY